MTSSVEVTLSFKGDLSDPVARALMEDLLAAAARHPGAAVTASKPDVGYEEMLDYVRGVANPKDVPATARRMWRAVVRAVRSADGEEDLHEDDQATDIRLTVASLKILSTHPEYFDVTRIADATRQRILAFIAEL